MRKLIERVVLRSAPAAAELVRQRDELGAQIRMLESKIEQLEGAAVRDPAELELGRFSWLLSSPPMKPVPKLESSVAPEPDDDVALIKRVMEAYRRACREYVPTQSGWDTHIGQLNKSVHDALIGDDVAVAAKILRDPGETTHFWGFDAIAKAPPGSVEPHEYVIKMLNAEAEFETLYPSG